MHPDAQVRVAGIVLAAGASSRMGRNKLLLQLDGESLLRRTVRRAATARLEPLLVVLGADTERAGAELAGLPCRALRNPDPGRGQASSLRVGLEALPESVQAVVVLLADMPRVTEEMIGALVGRYQESPANLVVSDYGGVAAPPTLYDRALFAELCAAEGGGRDVVARHRSEAASLCWPAEALADLDSPEDYARISGQ